MRKVFNKIIISFLLILIFIGGVSVFSVNKVFAATDCTAQENVVSQLAREGVVDPDLESALQACLTKQQQEATAAIQRIRPDAPTVCKAEFDIFDKDRTNVANHQAYNACMKKELTIAEAETAVAAVNVSFWDAIYKGVETLGQGPLKIVLTVISGIFQFAIIPVLGFLIRIIASSLDMAIQFTLDSKNISNINAAVTNAWALVRNIFNITFIFILLYTAIRTIIGSASANTKKMIANVVIAALLINFSLFITRILIDAGNILAITLYNQATNSGALSISSVIANTLGLGTIFASSGITCTVCTPFFIVTAIQTITMLTAIVVLMYITLLMFVRSIVLIFLMVLSPIGFMGDVLPQISEYSKMWRTNLYGQIVIAPIFLLLLSLIIKIGTTLNPGAIAASLDSSTDPAVQQVATGNAAYTAYFKYILIIILLFAAAKITKKMAGEVGGMVEKFGVMAAGAAVGYATGGLSLAATKTLGAGAAKIMNSGLGEKLKNSDNFAARMTLNGLDKTSKSTFELRNTEAFKEATGLIGEHTGLKVNYDRGIGIKKEGFQGAVERRAKEEEEYAKMVTKDMPKIKPRSVSEERARLETERAQAMALKQTEIDSINSSPSTTQADYDRMEKLQKEHTELANQTFDDEKIKTRLEKEAKDLETKAKNARLEVHAKAAEKGKFNWIIGGGIARKAAADKIRKLKGEKSAKDQLRELAKKQKEEDRAAGIAEPEEEKPKVSPSPAPAPSATPPPSTP